MKFPLRNHEKHRKCATHTRAHTHTCTYYGVLQLAQNVNKSQCSLVKGFASLL